MSSPLPPFARQGKYTIKAYFPNIPILNCDVRVEFEPPAPDTREIVETEITLRVEKLSEAESENSKVLGKIKCDCYAEEIANRLKKWDFDGFKSPDINAEMIAKAPPELFSSLRMAVVLGTYGGQRDPKAGDDQSNDAPLAQVAEQQGN